MLNLITGKLSDGGHLEDGGRLIDGGHLDDGGRLTPIVGQCDGIMWIKVGMLADQISV